MIPTIQTLMSKSLSAIDAAKSVEEAAEQMARLRTGSLLVRRDDDFVGMITDVDIVRKAVAKRLKPSRLRVEEVMSAPLITIRTDQSILEANALMEKHHLRHLGVTQFGRVVGVVSVRDFLHPILIQESPEAPRKGARAS